MLCTCIWECTFVKEWHLIASTVYLSLLLPIRGQLQYLHRHNMFDLNYLCLLYFEVLTYFIKAILIFWSLSLSLLPSVHFLVSFISWCLHSICCPWPRVCLGFTWGLNIKYLVFCHRQWKNGNTKQNALERGDCESEMTICHVCVMYTVCCISVYILRLKWNYLKCYSGCSLWSNPQLYMLQT